MHIDLIILKTWNAFSLEKIGDDQRDCKQLQYNSQYYTI